MFTQMGNNEADLQQALTKLPQETGSVCLLSGTCQVGPQKDRRGAPKALVYGSETEPLGVGWQVKRIGGQVTSSTPSLLYSHKPQPYVRVAWRPRVGHHLKCCIFHKDMVGETAMCILFSTVISVAYS